MKKESFGGLRNRKFAVLFLVLFLFTAPLWAQKEYERPYWFTLERGKLAFRTGAYGDALAAFADARTERREMYTRMEEDLIVLLSIPEVRRLGDRLEKVEDYIAGRSTYKNAARALAEVYYRVPKANLEGSARRVLVELNRLKDYPEAEYWIGETYQAEGELGIALRQYTRAYELRDLMENPAFAPEILYKIADIHRLRREYNEMEKRLLEILAADTLWTQSQEADNFMRGAMTRVLENENRDTGALNRFLTIYRHNNAAVLRAHTLLGFYYYTDGRHIKAVDHLLFAFLIQNTILIDELSRVQYGYTFSTLEGLLAGVARQSALADFFEELDYYKTVYYLGASYYGIGKTKAARDFWNFLEGQSGAGEWRARAAAQLKSPFVELPSERS